MVGHPSLAKKQGGTSHIAIEEVGHPLSKGVGCPKTGGLAEVDNRNVWAHPHQGTENGGQAHIRYKIGWASPHQKIKVVGRPTQVKTGMGQPMLKDEGGGQAHTDYKTAWVSPQME